MRVRFRLAPWFTHSPDYAYVILQNEPSPIFEQMQFQRKGEPICHVSQGGARRGGALLLG